MAQSQKNKNKNSAKSTSTKKGPSIPKQRPARLDNMTGRYIWAGIFAVLALVVIVSYFYNDGAILVFISDVFKGILGYGYWASGVCFAFLFICLCFSKGKKIGLRVTCLILFPVFFAALIELLSSGVFDGSFNLSNFTSDSFASGKELRSGGVLGSLLSCGLGLGLGKVGGSSMLILALIFGLFQGIGANFDTFRDAFANTIDLDESYVESTKKMSTKGKKEPVAYRDAKPVRKSIDIPIKGEAKTIGTSAKGKPRYKSDIPLGSDQDSLTVGDGSPQRLKNIQPLAVEDAMKIAGIENAPVPAKITKTSKTTIAASSDDVKYQDKKISKEDLEKATKDVADSISRSESEGVYTFPSVSLLNNSVNNGSDSRDEILANRERLELALRSFGINSCVVNITRGPTVTRYDIQLEQGVKLSKVTNLAGDLALSLGVGNVRVAPIPDEISTIGIEVPNKKVNVVSLREILESDAFIKSQKKLTFAIGKDIGGNCIVGNIAKLPHLLIAGTTGSGKSVCMNSLIISLIYKARPDEVKFIMIDPKMVELGIYNSIPHQLVPVVTEPKKAAGALQWAVVEMLKRYRMFADEGVRDLETYNDFCRNAGEPTLPQIVIVIDELADLMMAASKEVEESIVRVAQMGRAAGMHLVIATQRPSADVITGLMKANIPSRIAFAVASGMESRIIMDSTGAEKLVGNGDMLYSPLGMGKPLRVQGAFVSDEERERVIKFITANTDIQAELNPELRDYMNQAEKVGEVSLKEKDSSPAGDYDEMLPQAAEVVIEMKSCSVSMLQRRLKLGYSRAARIVDQLEELGIVGPYEGAKPRSVPIDRDGWQQIAVEMGFADAGDFVLAAEMSEQAEESFDVNL